MTQVTIRQVWKEYDGAVVLERVNLDIEPHSFVSIVGPSGCGKSTFLRMLLSQETPSRGFIRIDGEDLSPEPTEERGVVFQRYSVFPHLTALENVAFGLEVARAPFLGRLFGSRRKAVLEESHEALASVGLDHAAGKYPAQMSGGMQQRLAIAQALIKRPKVLLLDEPFGALDPGIRADMHRLMLKLFDETGMTVFMVTHDLKEAFHLGTRLVAFDRTKTRPEEIGAYGATITLDMPLDRVTARERSEAMADLAARTE
ncbi:MAG TPA: ABC transporter ATP-binding protein [Candidatus Omnitrophota bacterium]|nr:ABC transporter ATP-binding protein [Candidatus Omnitrophota bacterium]